MFSASPTESVILTRPGFVEEGKVLKEPERTEGVLVFRAGASDGIEVGVAADGDEARIQRTLSTVLGSLSERRP